jgi:DNA-binding XRE family transcriptional regulator
MVIEPIAAARERDVSGRAALARAADISPSTLYRIENHSQTRHPAPSRKIAVAPVVARVDLVRGE